MTAIARKTCPCCGQEIITPNDLTSLNLRNAHRLVLLKLWRNKGKLVSKEVFGYGPHSLPTFICHIREAIADSGLPYRIRTVHGQGYILEDSA